MAEGHGHPLVDIKFCLGCWGNNESQTRSKENRENKNMGNNAFDYH